MNDIKKVTFSVEETAQYLGIGRSLCYRMIKENKIPHIKFANRIVIPKIRLDEMLSK